jgi:hypothetical protein
MIKKKPLIYLIKSNITNLMLFFKSSYENNNINMSNIQNLFNYYKINMIEIKGRNTEHYIKLIEDINDSLNSMSIEFSKCSGGNNYEEFLKIIKDENEAQTSAVVRDENDIIECVKFS